MAKSIEQLQGEICALRDTEKKKQEAIGRVSALHNLMHEISDDTLQAIGINYDSIMAEKISGQITALQQQADGIKAERKTLAQAMSLMKKAERLLG